MTGVVRQRHSSSSRDSSGGGCGGRATTILDLNDDDLRLIFAFLPIPVMFRIALQVCMRWCLIVRTTPLSPPLLSLQNFHATFKETIWSCIDGGDGDMFYGNGEMLCHDGYCKTTKQAKAVASFLMGNGNIEKWNGEIL